MLAGVLRRPEWCTERDEIVAVIVELLLGARRKVAYADTTANGRPRRQGIYRSRRRIAQRLSHGCKRCCRLAHWSEANAWNKPIRCGAGRCIADSRCDIQNPLIKMVYDESSAS